MTFRKLTSQWCCEGWKRLRGQTPSSLWSNSMDCLRFRVCHSVIVPPLATDVDVAPCMVFCVLGDDGLVLPGTKTAFPIQQPLGRNAALILTLAALPLLNHSCLKQALQCSVSELGSLLSHSGPFLSLLPQDLCICFYCPYLGPLFAQISRWWLCLGIRLTHFTHPSILEWLQLFFFFFCHIMVGVDWTKPCP